MFKEDDDEGNAEEMVISASIESLENVRLFLLQQEDTGEQKVVKWNKQPQINILIH